MFLDGRRLSPGASLEADVCIIGAGAAAIPIALALADTPVRVLMLESGGLASDPGDRGIYRVVFGSGPGVGIDHKPWHFGGNTNHWFGNCRPLDEMDFATRDWIPHSGWPIARDELMPFYREAQHLCSLGDFDAYDLERCRPHLSHQSLTLRPGVLETRVVQSASVLRFGDLHRERLEAAANIRIFLHTRALQLETNDGGDAVDSVVASSEGRRCVISAATFVVAAGGIENARLLLCSDRSHPRGLGNDHDAVGRYFMEHPFIDIPFGRWRPPEELRFYLGEQRARGSATWGQIVLSHDLMQRERLPGLTFWFQRASPLWLTRRLAGRARDLLLSRAPLQNALAEIQNAGVDVMETITDAGRQTIGRLRSHVRGAGCGLTISFEQVPDPQNRVRLAPQRDRFGQRRVEVDFRLTDLAGHARSMKIAADELGLGARRIVERMLLRIRAGRVGFFSHHLGTTRMHRDPTQGVVDPDCRVHDTKNLFVAGGSVFPTGGTAPPTLTIVALAVRLAEHIRRSRL